MHELAAFVISWNRPAMLAKTLSSIARQTEGMSAEIFVFDNGSDAETVRIIREHPSIAGYVLNSENAGINWGYEQIIPGDVDERYEFLLTSDADMIYRQHLRHALELLRALPGVGAASYQHSPEHEADGAFIFGGARWIRKRTERGCALFFRAREFQRFRPLPKRRSAGYDWWVIRRCPHSLESHGQWIAVLPGGAVHQAWRAGESTWQSGEIPEYPEHKL